MPDKSWRPQHFSAAAVGAVLALVASQAFAYAPLSGITALSSGGRTCGLTGSGKLVCWGTQNPYTNYAENAVAGEVAGLAGVVGFASGSDHTCVVTSSAAVKCWGGNGEGQLGSGARAERVAPYDVPGLSSGVAAVGAGMQRSCALLASGGVKCWGYRFGLSPVDQPFVSDAVAITVGREHVCVLRPVGAVRCWGDNSRGQLGGGTYQGGVVDVIGLQSGVTAIAAGSYHTCAVTSAGAVVCWGAYSYSGSNTRIVSPVPVAMPGLDSGMVAVATGFEHSCAMNSAGGVKCWGRNASGEVGEGTRTARPDPVDVIGLSSGAVGVSAGFAHSCALMAGGEVRCWGIGTALGVNYAQFGSDAVAVVGLGVGAGVTSLGASHAGYPSSYTCAVINATVRCWGGYQYPPYPTEIPGLSDVLQVSSGDSQCALTSAGAVKCWGRYPGNGAPSSDQPVAPSGFAAGAAAVAAGSVAGVGHTCALTTAGGLRCWGYNTYGQLGDGSIEARTTPVDVAGLSSGVTAISAGGGFNCALTTTGGVKCWGRNYDGALGNGSTSNSSVPVDVVGLGGSPVAIGAGDGHACAVMPSGNVKCWGSNFDGQLGDGTVTARHTAVDVVGLSGVVAIATGGRHTCALTTAGGVKCWGIANANGTAQKTLVPVDAARLTSGVSAISTGYYHTCAITSAYGVLCWGANDSGQLGDGTFQSWFPIPVLTPDAVNISATMSANPAGGVGKDVVYSVVVTNNGPDVASKPVTATITLPPDPAFVWMTTRWPCTRTANVVSCDFGLLAKESRSVTLVVRPTAVGPISASVSASGGDPDPDAINNGAAASVTVSSTPPGVPVLRYRLYSPVTLEHHFTTDFNEYNVLGSVYGWSQEGTVGKVLDNPGAFNGVQAVPYYRLFSPYSRWHHWTTDPNEYYSLFDSTYWAGEGVDGYIVPSATAGTVQLYRLLYPYLGLHHWTIDPVEYGELIAKYYWVGEGGSGYVIQ